MSSWPDGSWLRVNGQGVGCIIMRYRKRRVCWCNLKLLYELKPNGICNRVRFDSCIWKRNCTKLTSLCYNVVLLLLSRNDVWCLCWGMESGANLMSEKHLRKCHTGHLRRQKTRCLVSSTDFYPSQNYLLLSASDCCTPSLSLELESIFSQSQPNLPGCSLEWDWRNTADSGLSKNADGKKGKKWYKLWRWGPCSYRGHGPLCSLREKIVLALLNDFFQLNSSLDISQREIAERSQGENENGMYTPGHLGIRLTLRINSVIAISIVIQVVFLSPGAAYWQSCCQVP